MKGKIVNPNSVTDATVMNSKNQGQYLSMLQKVGKGKKKIEVELSKGSQKFLLQVMKELKKQMGIYEKQLPNVFVFFSYVEKVLEKDKKMPKVRKLLLSFEELDFLKLQMKDNKKGLESLKSGLKWYNFLKKMLYSTMIKQTEQLLTELK